MKVAAIQMCSSHVVQENLSAAKKLIEQATLNNAKLVVLPEMFAIMSLHPNDKVDVKEQYGSGIIQDFLAETAIKNNIWIVGGTIPLACNKDNKIRAACLVYNNHGDLVARYDKIHLFDVVLSKTEVYQESATTEPGDNLVVIDTPVGKLGLAVCFDLRFPDMFRALMKKGAEVIAVPAAFTVPTGEAHWELLLRSRAIDCFSYMIGACQGGTHSNNRNTFGDSLIVDPWGRIIAQKKELEPGVVYAEIDLIYLKKVRAAIPIR